MGVYVHVLVSKEAWKVKEVLASEVSPAALEVVKC